MCRRYTKTLRAAAALVLLISPVLGARAHAAKHALVQLSYQNLRVAHAFGTFTGSGHARVNTETAPTPSIMWAAGQVAGSDARVGLPPGPEFSRSTSWWNDAGTLARSHPGAAPPGGSIVYPPNTTAICFTAPADPPANPGSCAPRHGAMARSPGAKRFGGTARLLGAHHHVGFLGVGFSYRPFVDSVGATAMLTGPATLPGAYGIIGNGAVSLQAGTHRYTYQTHRTEAPWTTGVVRARRGSNSDTFVTSTGSHSFHTENLTGMISVVRPTLVQVFRRVDGTYERLVRTRSRITRVTLTFLPEPRLPMVLFPGVALLLALGRGRASE